MSNGWPYLVAKGSFPTLNTIGIVGRNREVTALTAPETIWNGSGMYPFASFDATALGVGLVLYASSTEALDTQLILIRGLDQDWLEQETIVLLNGQNQSRIPGEWKRVFLAINANSTETTGDVYIAEADTMVGVPGIPDTVSKIKLKIDQIEQASEACIYTIPANKKAYFGDVFGGLIVEGGAPTNKSATLTTKVRLEHGIFFSTGTIGVLTNGTSIWNYHPKFIIEILPPKTDIQNIVTDVTDTCDVSAGMELLLEKI